VVQVRCTSECFCFLITAIFIIVCFTLHEHIFLLICCSFSAFWLGMDPSVRQHMTREKTDTVLKVLVKHFFIEKEVASTLVIDSLYSGLKALEYQSKNKKGTSKLTESDARSTPMVFIDQDMFVLVDDVIALLERAALDTLPHQPLPTKDDKSSQNRTKVCMFLLLALIRVTSIIEN
jgi:glutaredoxin